MRCQHPRRRRRPRRGTSLALLSIFMIPLIGALALALDGGMLVAERRRAQTVADAAAQAAALKLYRNAGQITTSTPDPSGQAKKVALAIAAANGYANDGTTSTVTINIPPLTGPNTGKLGYAEVITQNNQPRAFSAIWQSGLMSVKARTVARGPSKGRGIGLLLLDPSMPSALSQVGNGTALVTGGSVIVDSSSSSAATLNGNATITAQNIKITGNYATTGNSSLSPTPTTGATATPDPYATLLTPPNPSTMTTRSSSTLIYSGGSYTLQPGVYVGGISISGQASLTLSPGIYYLQGGGLSFSGQGSLTGNGVLIYNAPQSSSDGINLSGQGTITLTPMTSGPYANLTIFQDRTSTAPVNLTGNGALSVSGTIYAAKAPVSLTGNGTTGTDTYGFQVIADSASLSGNGTINVGQGGGVRGLPDIRIVE